MCLRHQENCGRKARGRPLPSLQAPAESPLGTARQEWGCRNCKLGSRCCYRKELLGRGCRPRLGQFRQQRKPSGSRAGPSPSLGASWCPLWVWRSQAAQSRPASERGCRAEYRGWGLVTCPQLCSVKIRVPCGYSVTQAPETYPGQQSSGRPPCHPQTSLPLRQPNVQIHFFLCANASCFSHFFMLCGQ